MNFRTTTWTVVLLYAALTAGCGTLSEEHRGATVGAGAGAATGAAAGAIFGEGSGAVVMGGLLGALVGGAIGHYGYDQRRDRQETVETYDYRDSYGTVLTIEDSRAAPSTARPGEVVDIDMTYALMNPGGTVKVTEIREITHNGSLVGKPEVSVERGAGTYTSTVPIRLPENAERGTYRVKTIVASENARDTRSTTFSVR